MQSEEENRSVTTFRKTGGGTEAPRESKDERIKRPTRQLRRFIGFRFGNGRPGRLALGQWLVLISGKRQNRHQIIILLRVFEVHLFQRSKKLSFGPIILAELEYLCMYGR